MNSHSCGLLNMNCDDNTIDCFPQGCVCMVGRTPFPSPQHPNAVFCCHSCYVKFRWGRLWLSSARSKHHHPGKEWVRWTIFLFWKCLDQPPQSRLTRLSLHSGEGKINLLSYLMTYLGQSSSSPASSFWRTEASCLRSTTRNTEQRNRRSGSLKAQKTSTGVFSTWFVNFSYFESHYRLQNI